MRRIIPLLSAAALLAGCQQTNVNVRPGASGQHALAVATLQKVNAGAHACWQGDKAFNGLAVIPELDTTGTPRILVLPKGKRQALPQLVIAATGRQMQTYGPLAQSPLAPRINADILRWASGGTGCAA